MGHRIDWASDNEWHVWWRLEKMEMTCVCEKCRFVQKRHSERSRPSIVFKIYNNNLSTTHQQRRDQHFQLFTLFFTYSRSMTANFKNEKWVKCPGLGTPKKLGLLGALRRTGAHSGALGSTQAHWGALRRTGEH